MRVAASLDTQIQKNRSRARYAREGAERIANCGRPLRDFDETLRTALDFLANPWNLWASERLEDKRAVLKLTFADRLAYVRNEGFRTANLALPFKALADLSGNESNMARPAGFESRTRKPFIILGLQLP